MSTQRKAERSTKPPVGKARSKNNGPASTRSSINTKQIRSKRSGAQGKASPKAKQPLGAGRTKRSSVPKTKAQYSAKPEKFKDTWHSVLAVVSKMRREKVSLAQASRDVGVSPRAVAKWGKQALRKGANGKYVVTRQDSLLRIVLIPTPDGPKEIAVRGSKQVVQLAQYWNALHRYLQTGDGSRLKPFEGKKIKDANGVEILLLTNRAALNRLGSAGVLSFESIYARTA